MKPLEILLKLGIISGITWFGYYVSSLVTKVPEFVVTIFGVVIAFLMASLTNELVEDSKKSRTRKQFLEYLMFELEDNYNKLSGEQPNEILVDWVYHGARLNNTLDLIDWDTSYKLGKFYEKIYRINDDVTRLLNFVYSSAQSLHTFEEQKNCFKNR